MVPFPQTTKGERMAGKGLVGRLANLWRGFLALWIADAERRNPEIAYENAIAAMVEKYAALRRATAALIRRREELEGGFRARGGALEALAPELQAAVSSGADDVALLLIQKKQQLVRERQELRGDLDTAMREAEAAKAALQQVQVEIRKLKAEKDSMVARLRSAEARLRIQEQLEGLSVDADVKALENVREHIRTVVAEASLGHELDAASLDGRLAAVSARTAELSARQELERLKAEKAQLLLPKGS
jgi:phage shock protein A